MAREPPSRLPILEDPPSSTPSSGRQPSSRLHPTPPVVQLGINGEASSHAFASTSAPRYLEKPDASPYVVNGARVSPSAPFVEPPSPGMQERRSSRAYVQAPEMNASTSRQSNVAATANNRIPSAPQPSSVQQPAPMPTDRHMTNGENARQFSQGQGPLASAPPPNAQYGVSGSSLGLGRPPTVSNQQPPTHPVAIQSSQSTQATRSTQQRSVTTPAAVNATTPMTTPASRNQRPELDAMPARQPPPSPSTGPRRTPSIMTTETREREPSVRAPSPVAPSINSVARPPSAPPMNSRPVVLDPQKKVSVFTKIFRPSKTASKEPRVENPLTRVVSDNPGGRKLVRQASTAKPKPKSAPGPWTAAAQRVPLPRTTSSSSTTPKPATATMGKSYAEMARAATGQPAAKSPTPTGMPATAAPPRAPSAPPNVSRGSSDNVATITRADPVKPGRADAPVERPSQPLSGPGPYRKAETDNEAEPSTRQRRPSLPAAGPKQASGEAGRRLVRAPPSLRIPPPSVQFAEKKSPIKSVLTMRFLTSQRRHRTVSAASLEALDGTVRNCVFVRNENDI
jgi:hypothetical protein